MILVPVIMSAAGHGSIAKEQLAQQIPQNAALFAKATTFLTPAEAIMGLVMGTTVMDIVRLNVNILALLLVAEMKTMKHLIFLLTPIPAVRVFVTTTVIV